MGKIKLINVDLVHLDRFDGIDFTKWQDKLKFLVMALKIFYILDPKLAPLAEPMDEDTEAI